MKLHLVYFHLMIFILLLITGCSTTSHTRTIYQPDYGRDFSGKNANTPPADIHDDICQIYAFDRNWKQAARAAEQKWGTPQYILLAFVHQESKFVKYARPSYRGADDSTAYGYSQAQAFTWKEYQQDINNPKAKRTNIYDALDFIGWYNDNSNQRNNIPKTDARNLYLAYHEGNGGYERKTYRSKPWLIKVSNQVDYLAKEYKSQLSNCP